MHCPAGSEDAILFSLDQRLCQGLKLQGDMPCSVSRVGSPNHVEDHCTYFLNQQARLQGRCLSAD